MIETEQIWTDLRGRITEFVRSRVRDIDDAEDIVQEAFIKIHRGADDLLAQRPVSD